MRAKAPPPPKGKKGKKKQSRSKEDNGTTPGLNGDEPSEEVVDDDELFE